MCSTLFSFAQLAAKQRSPQRETTTFASNDNAGATCILFPHDFFSLLDHKKLRAKKTVREHDLGHKKLHAKRPIWSTIWSTKSCTRKRPSGARFGAQKVAREKTVSGARFGAQKVAREEPPSGARFRAQKVARKKADLEHDLDHKNLHATKPIWSTEDSLIGLRLLQS